MLEVWKTIWDLDSIIQLEWTICWRSGKQFGIWIRVFPTIYLKRKRLGLEPVEAPQLPHAEAHNILPLPVRGRRLLPVSTESDPPSLAPPPWGDPPSWLSRGPKRHDPILPTLPALLQRAGAFLRPFARSVALHVQKCAHVRFEVSPVRGDQAESDVCTQLSPNVLGDAPPPHQ
jgi:hypothetical protein